jgi:hypothetical protein
MLRFKNLIPESFKPDLNDKKFRNCDDEKII